MWKLCEYFKNQILYEWKKSVSFLKDLYLSFEFADTPNISKYINKLGKKKTYQENDIPVKLVKSRKDLFSHFI